MVRRERLVARRKMLGYSQEKLAELLEVAPSTIGCWETGQTTPLEAKRPLIGRVLKLTPERLEDYLLDANRQEVMNVGR